MKLARPEGVGRVVLIQHSVYHLWDNSYLLDAVKRHPKAFRVQGMVDDHKTEPGAAMKRLLPLGVTGFRITPFVRTKAEQPKWLDTTGMSEMWKTGAETRQAMCLLINPADLPATDAMCEKHPDTPVVIDHFARIGADGEIRDADVKALCQLARHKHTFVKMSAFYALGKKKPPHDELVPMIRRLLEAFGPKRLMWASDSPYQTRGRTRTRRRSPSSATGWTCRRRTASGCWRRRPRRCSSTPDGTGLARPTRLRGWQNPPGSAPVRPDDARTTVPRLKTGSRGRHRLPHKPLLVLSALGR